MNTIVPAQQFCWYICFLPVLTGAGYINIFINIFISDFVNNFIINLVINLIIEFIIFKFNMFLSTSTTTAYPHHPLQPQVPVYPYDCSPIEDAGYDNLVDAIAVNDPLYGPKEFQPSWGTTLIGVK